MKIKLVIATDDLDYVNHLSKVIIDKFADTIEVSVCSTPDRFESLLSLSKYDVVIFEQNFAHVIHHNMVRLPLLFAEQDVYNEDEASPYRRIQKYQRVSSIVGDILEKYAELSTNVAHLNTGKARITAVWSPSGGVGKTTVALAYAAHHATKGQEVIYLNLESFSSIDTYFANNGKSISTVFEKLDSNVRILLKGIQQHDSATGIKYYGSPSNYDDINILTADDIAVLIKASANEGEQIVVDLSSYCDDRVQKVFELADTVLIVCDNSSTSITKLKQFINQHNIAQRIQAKSVLIANKGIDLTEPTIKKTLPLPFVQSNDPISVYKTLSGARFEW